MENKVELDWFEFLKDIKSLALKIKGQDSKPLKFNKILAIGKGGIIPAYYLAKYLGIFYIEVLPVSSYSDNGVKLPSAKVVPSGRKTDNRIGWLIVDDLCDSGDTLKIAKKYFPKSSTAVLYHKGLCMEPDYFVKKKAGWIIFPWEMDDLKLTLKI